MGWHDCRRPARTGPHSRTRRPPNVLRPALLVLDARQQEQIVRLPGSPWPCSATQHEARPAGRAGASEKSRDPLTSDGGGGLQPAQHRRRTQAQARDRFRRPRPALGLATQRAQAAERLASIQISTSRLMFRGIRSCGKSRSTVSEGNFSSSSHRPPSRIVSRMGRSSSGGPSISTGRAPRSHVQIFTRRATWRE
jgi:hypothetical protein